MKDNKGNSGISYFLYLLMFFVLGVLVNSKFNIIDVNIITFNPNIIKKAFIIVAIIIAIILTIGCIVTIATIRSETATEWQIIIAKKNFRNSGIISIGILSIMMLIQICYGI